MKEDEYVPAVTTEGQLDAILLALFAQKLNGSFADHENSGYNIEAICQHLDPKIEKAQVHYLGSILLNDEFIDPLHENFPHIVRISNKGVQFITSGGYIQQLKDETERKKIELLEISLKKSTISTNKWAKIGVILSLVISLASIIVSIIALRKD